MFYGLFDKVEVNCSVVTRSVGTDVQYACRRKRINVLNAAGEVAFAGDGEHHFRMKLFGDFAGKRAAGSDAEMKAEPFGHGNERADGTAVAAFAVIYIVRDFMRAGSQLQTVRRDDEQFACFDFDFAVRENVIVQSDERAFDFAARYAEDFSPEDNQRK